MDTTLNDLLQKTKKLRLISRFGSDSFNWYKLSMKSNYFNETSLCYILKSSEDTAVYQTDNMYSNTIFRNYT